MSFESIGGSALNECSQEASSEHNVAFIISRSVHIYLLKIENCVCLLNVYS